MSWRWLTTPLWKKFLIQSGGLVGRRPVDVPNAQRVCDLLLAVVDSSAPGRGADIHSPHTSHDWPSAYALNSSACFAMNATNPSREYLQKGLTAARWLAGHTGCASTGAPCWGVPYPRKIWEDTHPAKAGTAFAIPTCHAIQALDEAAEIVGATAEARAFRLTAARAAEYFAENCCDEFGDELVIWYSPLRQHSFHITNAIAMLAGQFQRMASHSANGDLLADKADRAVRYLLKRKATGVAGPCWDYFGDRIPSNKKNKRNDLLHEAFVCHGLIEYKANGGRLSDAIDYSELLAAIGKFERGGAFYEFPEDELIKARTMVPARAMGIGHALYVASRIERETGDANDLSGEICNAICTRYVDQGDLYHRPMDTKITAFVRDVGHILFGLTEHIRNTN